MASRSWNRVELIGNLTRDPELRYTPSGAAVATFTIATNRSYISDGERKEEADFHRIVAWNKLAELCSQLLKKGTRVFVSGRLQNRSWEGQDGQTRQVTETVIEDMIVLTPKNGVVSDFSEDVTPKKDLPDLPTEEHEKEKSADKTEEKKEESIDDAQDKKPASTRGEPKTEDPGNLDDLPF